MTWKQCFSADPAKGKINYVLTIFLLISLCSKYKYEPCPSMNSGSEKKRTHIYVSLGSKNVKKKQNKNLVAGLFTLRAKINLVEIFLKFL